MSNLIKDIRPGREAYQEYNVGVQVVAEHFWSDQFPLVVDQDLHHLCLEQSQVFRLSDSFKKLLADGGVQVDLRYVQIQNGDVFLVRVRVE